MQIAIASVVLLVVAWIIYGNINVKTKSIEASSKVLPEGFDGFKIAHISDLHNAEFGRGNKRLIALLKSVKADIIVITGDLIDSRRTNIAKALRFAENAAKIAPTYYAHGNHESRLDESDYNTLMTGFEKAGVTVLENDYTEIFAGDEKISLFGVKDASFEGFDENDTESIMNYYEKKLADIELKNDDYKILLVHRPEYIDVYKDKVDLAFSGHVHGGQFILPFLGGLFGPGQGLLPKYYDGLYRKGKTNLVVSRGLGNSLFPFRFNNNPVVVVAKLTKDKN